MLSNAPVVTFPSGTSPGRERSTRRRSAPSAGAGTSRASAAFWAVEDVAAEVAALKSRGVTFEEYDMPGIKTVESPRDQIERGTRPVGF